MGPTQPTVESLRRWTYAATAVLSLSLIGVAAARDDRGPVHEILFAGSFLAGATLCVCSWRLSSGRDARSGIRSEEGFRYALESVGDGVWDYETSTGACYYSPSWRAMFGFGADEPLDTIQEWVLRIHPEDRSITKAAYAGYVNGASSKYVCEYRLRTKDGEYRWVQSRGKFITDAAGRTTSRMIGTTIDISARKEAERVATDRRDLLRAVVDNIPIAIALCDRHEKIELANAEARSLLGNEAIPLCPTVCGVCRSADRCIGAAPADARWLEADRRDQEGKLRRLQYATIPLPSGMVLIIAQDVTARHETERLLLERENLLKRAVCHAPVPLMVYDESGTVLAISDTWCELSGYAREEIPTIRRWTELAYGARSNQVEGMITSLFDLSARKHEGDFHIRCRAGEERIWDFSSSPVGHAANGRKLMISVAVDVTELRATSRRLSLAEQALRATPTPVLVTDPNGIIQWVNPAFNQVTGYSDAEVIGATPRILNSGKQSREVYENLWATIRRGEVWRGQLCNRKKDGGLYYQEMIVAPVRDAEGKINHYVAVQSDVTSQRQLEQQLARAQRLESIGLLASGLAHDLNNVLTPIVLSLAFLRETAATKEDRDCLKLIDQAAQRGAGIIRQVLSFARGLGGQQVELEPTALVREVVQLVHQTFPKNISVISEMAGNECKVNGDPTGLHQALLNLAVNARDAMPDGGRIAFSTRGVVIAERSAALAVSPGRYVEISVTDTGCGIPAEVVEHVFDPFFTTKPVGSGTGLGLSSVYGIVRAHKGAIELRSRPGDGTVASIYLPVAEAPGPAAVASPERVQRTKVSKGHGQKILVVDDEPLIRLMMAKILSARNLEIVEADNGEQALNLFRLGPSSFALVITDMMMPRMGGGDLVRAIRRLDPCMPVIAISGLPSSAEKDPSSIDVSGLGINTYLTKPFTEAELLAAIAAEVAIDLK